MALYDLSKQSRKTPGYKKDCLPKVVAHLKTWQNDTLVKYVIEEIIDVHHRYRNFSALLQARQSSILQRIFPDTPLQAFFNFIFRFHLCILP